MEQFIEVDKIIYNSKTGIVTNERDNIKVSDIKSFRKWKKADYEEKQVDGPMTQVSILSPTASEGFYNIRIHEDQESFGKRVGTIKLNDK